MSPLAYFAVDDDGSAAQFVEVIPQRVDRHIDRSRNGAALVLFCGANVDEQTNPLR